MSVKPVSKSVMPVGNYSVSNTVSSLTDKCHLIRLSVVVMMLSTLSSVKLVLVNTSPRCVFLDLEPTVIDEVRTGTYRQLFHPE